EDPGRVRGARKPRRDRAGFRDEDEGAEPAAVLAGALATLALDADERADRERERQLEPGDFGGLHGDPRMWIDLAPQSRDRERHRSIAGNKRPGAPSLPVRGLDRPVLLAGRPVRWAPVRPATGRTARSGRSRGPRTRRPPPDRGTRTGSSRCCPR